MSPNELQMCVFGMFPGWYYRDILPGPALALLRHPQWCPTHFGSSLTWKMIYVLCVLARLVNPGKKCIYCGI